MPFPHMLRLSLGLILLSCSDLTATPLAPPNYSIFDGSTLQGWSGDQQVWRVEDGAIVAEISSGDHLAENQWLFWDTEVNDFEFSTEFKINGNPGANSGIQFRAQRDENDRASGYQADLDGGATWLGRIYDEHGRALLVERGNRVAIAPDGRRWVDTFAELDTFDDLYIPNAWNTYRITARASHVEVWINDRLCAVLDDHEDDEADLSGYLAFQMHSGPGPAKVQFRNITLVDLGRTAPTPHPLEVETVNTPVVSIAPTTADGRDLNFDFETGDLTDWIAEGNTWRGQPLTVRPANTATRRSDTGDVTPSGRRAISPVRRGSYSGTGRLTSVPFTVTHPWASYVVDGHEDINLNRVELLLEQTGAIVSSSPAGKPQRGPRQEVVDLTSVVGDKIQIRLVDESVDLNGQITFDTFKFHDADPSAINPAAVREGRLHESPVLWHLQPNSAAPSEVKNVDAQSVVRDMKLQPGFAADLIAAEPSVHQPIAFAIDPQGRLWVAEAYSYPTKRPEGEGLDRIVIFADSDGDGSFETRKVFTAGLNLVSGLEVGFGGVWVGAAPELLFIPDRDGDDRPDGPAEVVLDGWGFQDTHETLNSFTWGPDGWLYGLQGVFAESNVGIPGATDSERQNLRAGVWRYHPVRGEFEVFAHGGSNQWGIDFNAMGHLFITHCRSYWGGGGTTHVIRNGHYWNQANSNYPDFISNRAPDFAPELRNYLPSSAKYDSGEGGAGKSGTSAVYGGHSHVGTMIYLGDNWPGIYRDHLFTHNLHGHQLNHQHNVREGSGYETLHAGNDLMFTPDSTFMGVDLQYGPDGSVYMIDWCDHQHCHSPREDIWERNNGRIYRLKWAESWEPTSVNLSILSDDDLAALHTHPNAWFVRTARRLLQERSTERALASTAIEILRVQAHNATATPDFVSAQRAWFTLHVTGQLSGEDLRLMLASPSDITRSLAVTFATEQKNHPGLTSAELLDLAAYDTSPTVRLAIASALPHLNRKEAWSVAATLTTHGQDAGDRFLPRMIWFGLAPMVEDNLLRAVRLAGSSRLPSVRDSLQWFICRTPEGRNALVNQLLQSPPAATLRGVEIMAFALSGDTALSMPSNWPKLQKRVSSFSPEESVTNSMRELSALFGDESVLAEARSLLGNSSTARTIRRGALQLLKRADDTSAHSVFLALLDDPDFRRDAVERLARFGHPVAANAILEDFETLGDRDRAQALATLTGRPAYALALLAAIEAGTFDRGHLTALHLRHLRNLRNEQVDAFTARIWIANTSTQPDASGTMERLRKTYHDAPKWAFSEVNGQATFKQLCASCHLIKGEGGHLGPDLTSSWRNGIDYFLESVVDPNGVVGADFQLNLITKKDGAVISGMIERETATTLVVRTGTETINVPVVEIDSRQVLPQSLMPPGLFEALTNEQYIELMKYLLSRK